MQVKLPWGTWLNTWRESINSPPLDKMAAILADDIFKGIFLNENDRILIQISLKFVPRGPVDNKWALVQVMACCLFGLYLNQCWPGEPTKICGTRGEELRTVDVTTTKQKQNKTLCKSYGVYFIFLIAWKIKTLNYRVSMFAPQWHLLLTWLSFHTKRISNYIHYKV